MSSVSVIGGNTRVVSQAVSWVVNYFSKSFQKLAGNEYCSNLQKIQVSGHIHEHILFFRVSPRYLKLDFRLRFRTLAYSEPDIILRNFSIYPVKMKHIKIPGTIKVLVYWEPEAYSKYRESLEYSSHRTHNTL